MFLRYNDVRRLDGQTHDAGGRGLPEAQNGSKLASTVAFRGTNGKYNRGGLRLAVSMLN